MTPPLDPLDVLASLVLESGDSWGSVAHPFQWTDARRIIDPASPPFAFITRSRGSSKTTDLAALSLSLMVATLPPASRVYAAASDRDQARLLLDAAEGFVRRSPVLHGRLRVGAWKLWDEHTGSTWETLSADAASSWGLRPALVLVDELGEWPDTSNARKLWESLSSAAAKLRRCKLVCITTAGSPSGWVYKILEHARTDPLWTVSEREGPSPWLSPERVEEQRRRLPASSFARLFENVWTEAEDRLTDPADLAACVTLPGPLPPAPGVRYLVGVDVGLRRDATVAAVAHAEPLGEGVRVVLDRLQTWQGSRREAVRLADVEEWIAHASETFNGASVRLDPWQAVGLAQRLRSRGVHVEEYTFSAASVGRLAVTLHTLIRDRLLALPDDAALLDELAHVRLKESSPGVLRMDHDADRHDDRAIALALAASALLDRAPVPLADLAALETITPTFESVSAFDSDRWSV